MVDFDKEILEECKRQWHENQEADGLGTWEEQSEEEKQEYYKQIERDIKCREE